MLGTFRRSRFGPFGARLFSSSSGGLIQAAKFAAFRSESSNILENFAFEKVLLHAPVSSVLFLWVNKTVVTIGKHQNAWRECALGELEKDQVELVRRQSGGGAVLQDEGCLTFTFIGGEEHFRNLKDFTKRNFGVLLSGLKRAGIPDVEVKGRNDMVWLDKNSGEEVPPAFKISGSAFKQMKVRDPKSGQHTERFLHHGTLLFDTDFARLGRYLTPSKEKLASKGIKSVAARVVNLKNASPMLTLDGLQTAMEEAFVRQSLTEFPKTYFTPDMENAKILKAEQFRGRSEDFDDVVKEMSDWHFRFGKSPDFSHQLEPTRLERRTDEGETSCWGTFEAGLDVESGKIVGGKIFSDALLPEAVSSMNEALETLEGIEYRAETLRQYLESKVLLNGTADELALKKDVIEWLAREINAV